MTFENFRPKGNTAPGILETVAQAEARSRDAIESTRLGFAFPVHEKIRNLGNKTVSAFEGRELSRTELIRTMLVSVDRAWKETIQPRIGGIRARGVSKESIKHGTDFFTEADVLSEELIRDSFVAMFGKQNLRIFGEEAAKYFGNIESNVGVRIDPIDGTESMKFGKPDWGIMAGVYEGRPENEREVAGVVYMPERHSLITYEEDAGVFVTDTETGEVQEIRPFEDQDKLEDIIINVWRHTELKQRGRIYSIENALSKAKGRVKSVAGNCNDVLDALLTGGARAMVIDGDYNEPDFICNRFLEKLGYSLHTWSGELVRADDASLNNKKLVIVPPGQAGKEILEIAKRFAKERKKRSRTSKE